MKYVPSIYEYIKESEGNYNYDESQFIDEFIELYKNEADGQIVRSWISRDESVIVEAVTSDKNIILLKLLTHLNYDREGKYVASLVAAIDKQNDKLGIIPGSIITEDDDVVYSESYNKALFIITSISENILERKLRNGIYDAVRSKRIEIIQKAKNAADTMKLIPFKGYAAFDYFERIIFVVEVNGVRLPFYISTGMARKTDVPSRRVYPIFGINEDSTWLNKTTGYQINRYYASPLCKAVSLKIEELTKNMSRKNDVLIVDSVDGDENEFYKFINKDQYVSPQDYKILVANISKKLNEFDENNKFGIITSYVKIG